MSGTFIRKTVACERASCAPLGGPTIRLVLLVEQGASVARGARAGAAATAGTSTAASARRARPRRPASQPGEPAAGHRGGPRPAGPRRAATPQAFLSGPRAVATASHEQRARGALPLAAPAASAAATATRRGPPRTSARGATAAADRDLRRGACGRSAPPLSNPPAAARRVGASPGSTRSASACRSHARRAEAGLAVAAVTRRPVRLTWVSEAAASAARAAARRAALSSATAPPRPPRRGWCARPRSGADAPRPTASKAAQADTSRGDWPNPRGGPSSLRAKRARDDRCPRRGRRSTDSHRTATSPPSAARSAGRARSAPAPRPAPQARVEPDCLGSRGPRGRPGRGPGRVAVQRDLQAPQQRGDRGSTATAHRRCPRCSSMG